jgi:hypothetical protein
MLPNVAVLVGLGRIGATLLYAAQLAAPGSCVAPSRPAQGTRGRVRRRGRSTNGSVTGGSADDIRQE